MRIVGTIILCLVFAAGMENPQVGKTALVMGLTLFAASVPAAWWSYRRNDPEGTLFVWVFHLAGCLVTGGLGLLLLWG